MLIGPRLTRKRYCRIILVDSVRKVLVLKNKIWIFAKVKDIVNPYNSLLKNANFSMKTSNE